MVTKKLVLTTAMAATLSTLGGCAEPSPADGEIVADRGTAVCVDQEGNRVEDTHCGKASGGGSGLASAFLWYYVGRGGIIPRRGDNINDPNRGFTGSHFAAKGVQYAAAPAAANIARSPAESRGGFGSSGSKFIRIGA